MTYEFQSEHHQLNATYLSFASKNRFRVRICLLFVARDSCAALGSHLPRLWCTSSFAPSNSQPRWPGCNASHAPQLKMYHLGLPVILSPEGQGRVRDTWKRPKLERARGIEVSHLGVDVVICLFLDDNAIEHDVHMVIPCVVAEERG
jgi:hypothetical protein